MQKHVALCGILMFCLTMSIGSAVGADSMYWDPGSPTSGEISQRDFKFKYSGPESKSLDQMEIYDQGRATSEPATVSTPIPNAYTEPPLPPPPVTQPLPSVNRPIRAIPQVEEPLRPTPARPTVQPSEPVRSEPKENTAAQDVLDSPEPVTAVVGKTTEKPPVSTMEATRPPQKKMQWGRTEETAPQAEASDTKRSFEESSSNTKFKWGR